MNWLWRSKAPEETAASDATPKERISTITPELPILDHENAIFYYDPFDLEQRKKDEAICPQFAAERAVFEAGGVAAVTPSPSAFVPEPPTPAVEGEVTPDWQDDASNADAMAASITTPASSLGDAELKRRLQEENLLVDEVLATVGIEYPNPAEDKNDQKKFKLQLDVLRFLRARKMNVPEAAQMFASASEWFEKENPNTILAKADPLAIYFRSITPTRHHGVDYLGNPVYYERTGMCVIGDVLKHMTEDDIVTRHIRLMMLSMDRMNWSSSVHGKNVGGFVVIHDLAHLKFSIEAAGVRIFKKTLRYDQDFFPERLYRAFIINAPMSFRGVWAMIKPLLDPKTSQKIQILGADYKQALLECIPPTQLPAHYGGLCQCTHENDPMDFCLPHKVRQPTDPEEELTPEWPMIIPRTEEQRAEAEVILAKAAEKAAAKAAAATL